MQAWHVVLAKPNQEARAAVELARQDFRVFLPVLDAKPMFPRYIFVQFDRDTDNWGTIKSTRGCIGLLRNGFIPANVPEHLITALMSYRPPQEPVQAETVFSAGQPIRIVEGPLAGLEGLFVADKKARIMCLLELCGKKVEVPTASIRAA